MLKYILLIFIVSVSCAEKIVPSTRADIARFGVVDAKSDEVTLTWKYHASELSYFILLRDTQEVAKIEIPIINTYTDKGLKPMTEYTYSLKAVSKDGDIKSDTTAVARTTKNR